MPKSSLEHVQERIFATTRASGDDICILASSQERPEKGSSAFAKKQKEKNKNEKQKRKEKADNVKHSEVFRDIRYYLTFLHCVKILFFKYIICRTDATRFINLARSTYLRIRSSHVTKRKSPSFNIIFRDKQRKSVIQIA